MRIMGQVGMKYVKSKEKIPNPKNSVNNAHSRYIYIQERLISLKTSSYIYNHDLRRDIFIYKMACKSEYFFLHI